jgi:hypothetical protein
MGNTVTGFDKTPCLTRIKAGNVSTPIRGDTISSNDESFMTDLYNEYFDWAKSLWRSPDVVRKLENENRQLRRRINQLENEMEWSRMDAIESHYRTVGRRTRRKPEIGSTSISMLNLSGSSTSDDEDAVRYIPHKEQVSGRGDVKLLLHVGIGSVGEQSTSLLVSAPDKENMIPRN